MCLNRPIDTTGLSPVRLQPCRPLPAPLLHDHYSHFITTTSCSVLVPSTGILTLVDFATWISPLSSRRLVPAVPYKSLNQTHATCTPNTTYPVIRSPVDLSESNFQTLILISQPLTTLHQWFVFTRLFDRHLPSTLTTITLNYSRLRRFEACF